jgi:hypothetical protein
MRLNTCSADISGIVNLQRASDRQINCLKGLMKMRLMPPDRLQPITVIVLFDT